MSLSGKLPEWVGRDEDGPWWIVLRPVSRWTDLGLRELWRFRDLIALLVRRDFLAQYAQTVLGPAWYLVQPILTTIMFTLVFGRVARLPTDGVPPWLFYMTGVVAWGYFSNCVTRTSTTFVANAQIFGKVWFPRLAIPISVTLSSLFAFAIQLALLLVMRQWAVVRGEMEAPGWGLLLLPLYVVQMGVLGLGCGVVISSLTTKYRDLSNLVSFGVQLWMFATPVVYPASRIPHEWEWLLFVNPMGPVVEGFRICVLGAGSVSPGAIAASVLSSVVILAGGAILFGRIEKSFMDTV